MSADRSPADAASAVTRAPWVPLYLRLLVGLAVLLVLFGRSLGLPHNAAMVVLCVATMPILAGLDRRLRPLVEALTGSRSVGAGRCRTATLGRLCARTRSVSDAGDLAARADALGPCQQLAETAKSGRPTSAVHDSRAPCAAMWFAFTLFTLAWIKFCVLGAWASGFMPALHDEWSYLFGAETLARGRLWNEPPPHPEFFDAFHVLCTDRWVTRYPPGHPALLAIGVWLGWPALVPISLGAATVLASFWLAREVAGDAAGMCAGVLALVAPGLDLIATTFLSQATFVPAMAWCHLASLRAVSRADWRWALVAGSAGGLAILARPYSAVAMGLPPAVWFVWRVLVSGPRARGSAGSSRLLASAALPLALTAVLWAGYNRATTGHLLRTAWQEYNRRYEPDNTLGFASAARPIPSALEVRKAEKARGIAGEKAAFTAAEALRRVVASPMKLMQWLLPAVGFAGLLAFLPRGLAGGPLGLLLLTGCSHYIAYSFFYSRWGAYGLEVLPLVLALAAAGLVSFWHDAAATTRPSVALVAPLFLVAAIAFAAFVHLPRFVAQRREDTAYHRHLATLMDQLPRTPAVLFVRLDPNRPHPYDPMHNSPGLTGRVVLAWDLGLEANRRLWPQAFRARRAYLWDERRSRLYDLQFSPR